MGKRIKNLIFDWSGTLVDDLQAVWLANNEVFNRSGVRTLTLEEFQDLFELPFTEFYRRHLPDVSLSQIDFWFHSAFARNQHLVKPLRHVVEFVKFARRSKVRLFVLSSVRSIYLLGQAKQTGLAPFFDALYGGAVDKRQALPRLLAEQRLDPKETMFVGDMEHDIEAARSAGVWSCAILTGYRKTRHLKAARPDLLVLHLKELGQLLEESRWRMDHLLSLGAERRYKDPVLTVGALVIDKKNKVLLVRTRKWSDYWGVPDGKVEYGEAAARAVAEKVLEETCLEVDSPSLFFIDECIEPEEFYCRAHLIILFYLCRILRFAESRLNGEAYEACWVSVEEALNMQLNTPTRRLINYAVAKGVAA